MRGGDGSDSQPGQSEGDTLGKEGDPAGEEGSSLCEEGGAAGCQGRIVVNPSERFDKPPKRTIGASQQAGTA